MLALLLASAMAITFDETAPGCCGKSFVIEGDIQHYTMWGTVTMPGMEPGDFQEEVFGRDFVAKVDDIPKGSYEVLIALTEGYFDAVDQRVMSIECGDASARDVDILRASGGKLKPMVLRLAVNHPGGTLKIHFRALKDNAKFNSIVVKDTNGKPVASVRAQDLVDVELKGAIVPPKVTGPEIYKDSTKSPEARAKDLIRRMSLAEKVGQMVNNAKPIPRLGVKPYNWWNEALHGVAWGRATVYPQCIGLAATWDPALVEKIYDSVSTEARAKYAASSENPSSGVLGLTFWTPNINLFRDPRWGRGQETYGEDPYLMSEFGSAVVRGLQGPDRKNPKVVATLKHFAVHSGPEPERHVFDAVASNDDLYDTYLWHFERVVRDAKPWSIMGAYNRVFGEPACSSKFLLQEQLRDKWGFDGYVVSDCGAITDIWANHKVVPTKEEGCARAVLAGCDLECGNDYPSLVKAINRGLLTEKDLDKSLVRLFDARYRLGLMDGVHDGKWGKITADQYDTPDHDELAYRAAQRTQVLLTNDGILPLAKNKKYAVFGENAESARMLVGNYQGSPSHPVTVLQGLQKKADMVYQRAFPDALKEGESWTFDKTVLEKMSGIDTAIVVGGIHADLEGEEGAGRGFQGFHLGDRTTIALPAHQAEFVKALAQAGKKVVFVNCSGSAMSLTSIEPYASAILQAWYPGQRGGDAVADVLFGDFNPCGKLPVTFYRSDKDLPDFHDYSMKNRTHRFFTGSPEFPFGYGLSYTDFRYSGIKAVKSGSQLVVTGTVQNAGKRDGIANYSVMARPESSQPGKPLEMLIGIGTLDLKAGARGSISLKIPLSRLALWNETRKARAVIPGEYKIIVESAPIASVRL
ncbi:MAG: glycoside hydrolase family 3 C-terminal domain-containing protein [Armatimonadetes bacterium]|nr:glycoside hydrolase family 3 C-terminal domain-containing protein [Armatimonadota bacterium]